LDDDHHGVLVDHHKNVTDDRNDLKMVVNHVSRNYVLPDQNLVVKMDVSLYLRMNGMDDRNDLNLDVSLGLHMSDLLDDHSTDDDHHDALVGHRKNGMDDRNDLMTDVNRVNRNYAPRDRKMGANLDAMNRPVKLMVYLSKSCDRMSHDHLRCGHLKMRHHDTNRMDGKNLDGKMKIHHVNRRMMDDLMKVCPMSDDQKMILVMKSANYYRHDCLDVNLNNYLRTYLFLISLVVARYLVVLCNILLVAGVTYVISV
jgi:hypothetical protein